MNKVIYSITTEVYSFENDSRTAYGIVAYDHAESNDAPTVLVSFSDVCSDYQKLKELVDLCNRLNLSPIHLYDVLEDFLLT